MGWIAGAEEHYREEPGRTGMSKIGAVARTKGPLFSGCRQPARLLNRCVPRRAGGASGTTPEQPLVQYVLFLLLVAEHSPWCYPSQWCEGEPIPSVSG